MGKLANEIAKANDPLKQSKAEKVCPQILKLIRFQLEAPHLLCVLGEQYSSGHLYDPVTIILQNLQDLVLINNRGKRGW